VPTEPLPAPAVLTGDRFASAPPLDELRGSYRLRFARDEEDVRRCCRLRYEVFNLELGEGLEASAITGLDEDPFDPICHHLMVLEERTGEVVGTYRMQTREMALAGQGFYSAGEYDLSTIPEAMLREAVELGRAAILKEHRDRSVLSLLWRGLVAYQRWTDTRYLFGCSSLTSQDPEEGLRCHDYLARMGHMHPGFEARPLPGYVCEVEGHETFTGEYPIPKLFGFYLRYGAKLCSPPALDRYFGTIDFLTWMDGRSMVGRLKDAFAKGLPGRG
jgi:putative hemolysin